jgi:NAD(P)-dependent dehydrogenase (short-subunit alcohol dehydrogenase family)
MSKMPDKVALIIGGNRGIGLGVVKELLQRGWRVIATARKPAAATELSALTARYPGRLSVEELDMGDGPGVDAFARQMTEPVDVLLFNAGIAGPQHRSAQSATVGEIGELMFVNAVAPIRLARALAGRVRGGAGIIAFTSSAMGSVSQNTGGHELYRASKAALNSLTRGLWTELQGKNLTVLTLHPGWVRTDMGGSSAAVSIEDSARGLAEVLEREAGAHDHKFLDYRGKAIPW